MSYETKILELQKKIEILENMVEETTRNLYLKNELIQNALNEKEILLKEIHHRVKNNLQIICSLLNLQSEHTESEIISSIICESKNRIASMALIHEMLYSTKNLSQINVNDYISKLGQSVYRSFAEKNVKIIFEYNVDEELFFETENMIPIGLILNEVISNSIKYAFPNKQGVISITFSKKKKNYFLQVKDNGIGIPKEFDHLKAKSLGMQLIYILSDQLNGKLNLDRKNGTKYELTF